MKFLELSIKMAYNGCIYANIRYVFSSYNILKLLFFRKLSNKTRMHDGSANTTTLQGVKYQAVYNPQQTFLATYTGTAALFGYPPGVFVGFVR
jgi:hypothetical protein